MTTRGLKEEHMNTLAEFIDRVLSDVDNISNVHSVGREVKEFMSQFPMYL